MAGITLAFPANAGMNRWTCSPPSCSPGVPRKRGDEPTMGWDGTTRIRRSPQTRG